MTIQEFATILEQQQGEGRLKDFPDWQSKGLPLPKVKIVPGRKYTKVNIDDSGKYMIENDTGRIFGIKGYGVIHRGHYYGTLDTVGELDWSGFVGTMKLGGKAKIAKPISEQIIWCFEPPNKVFAELDDAASSTKEAAFVVRAVNSHDELVEALQLANECMRQVTAGGVSSMEQTPVSIQDTIKVVASVISRAGVDEKGNT